MIIIVEKSTEMELNGMFTFALMTTAHLRSASFHQFIILYDKQRYYHFSTQFGLFLVRFCCYQFIILYNIKSKMEFDEAGMRLRGG